MLRTTPRLWHARMYLGLLTISPAQNPYWQGNRNYLQNYFQITWNIHRKHKDFWNNKMARNKNDYIKWQTINLVAQIICTSILWFWVVLRKASLISVLWNWSRWALWAVECENYSWASTWKGHSFWPESLHFFLSRERETRKSILSVLYYKCYIPKYV